MASRMLRFSRPARFFLGTAIVGSGLWLADSRTEAQLVHRNIRTFYNGLALAVDYKLNFKPTHGLKGAEAIELLHERVANRIFDVFERNGGLYIKIGQVIGTQSAILPAAYQRRARRLFDAAPAIPFSVVERVFMDEFGGLHPNEVFEEFDETPIASASIAQVHKARLKNGDLVAVKIQKPAIQKQINSDLLAFRILLRVYEHLFDLPLSWSSEYIESQFRMETDFESEARNAQMAWDFLQQEQSLRHKVYIPKVYTEFSSKRVLVCEWIDGVQLTDTNKIESLGLSFREAMKTAIDAFSSQIFKSGFVHGDPHPGNVLVRQHPTRKKETQVVIIDHGLYIQESEKFRLEYCRLWESLFMLDLKTMNEICKSWGIHDANMFASITLQKPFSGDKAVHIPQQKVDMKDMYELQSGMKDRIKHFLEDQCLFPRELIFISRNMNLMRANNRSVGSPVNRINIMARWALRGISVTYDPGMRNFSKIGWLRHSLRSAWRTAVFEFTLMMMSLGFWAVKIRQRATQLVMGGRARNFEEVIDQRMRDEIYRQFGVVIDETLLDG